MLFRLHKFLMGIHRSMNFGIISDVPWGILDTNYQESQSKSDNFGGSKIHLLNRLLLVKGNLKHRYFDRLGNPQRTGCSSLFHRNRRHMPDYTACKSYSHQHTFHQGSLLRIYPLKDCSESPPKHEECLSRSGIFLDFRSLYHRWHNYYGIVRTRKCYLSRSYPMDKFLRISPSIMLLFQSKQCTDYQRAPRSYSILGDSKLEVVL